jgi:polyhydroxybutyrate depolymerase
MLKELFLSITILWAAAACAPAQAEPTASPPASPEPIDSDAPLYSEPGTYLDGIRVAGEDRAFLTYLPSGYAPGIQMPLVLNLHGRGSTALDQIEISQWHVKAEDHGFIVVSPQALGASPTWMGVFFDESSEQDMAFFSDLLAYLRNRLSIDPDRIYATGLSNGGSMSNRLGCDFSETFAAIAPVAGGHSGIHLCEIASPVSLLAVHGTDDRVIPYLGTSNGVPSVQTWVEAWASRDGCRVDPIITEPYPDVDLQSWRPCNQGSEVALLTVQGGGHRWLGLQFVWESGAFVAEVSATDAIWEFFDSHPRSKP